MNQLLALLLHQKIYQLSRQTHIKHVYAKQNFTYNHFRHSLGPCAAVDYLVGFMLPPLSHSLEGLDICKQVIVAWANRIIVITTDNYDT